jgi:hypothetical protein
MSKLRSIQLKKLLKELEYMELEFEYRTELVQEVDLKFTRQINEFLDENPTIKEVYDQKNDLRLQSAIESKINEIQSEVDELEVEDEVEELDLLPTVSTKVKKLYREIVKVTHPDLINKKNLNEIYLYATKYYNLNDKIGIYRICSELNIDYDIDEEDEVDISKKINEVKSKISFLESTWAWKWFTTESEREKNQIMIDFIKLRIVS